MLETQWIMGRDENDSQASSDGDAPLNEGGKRALDAERKQRKEIEKQYKELQRKFKQFEGVDLDEITSIKEKFEQFEDDQLKAQGDWETKKTRMQAEHQKAIQSVQQEAQKYKQMYEGLLIENELSEAFYNGSGKLGDSEQGKAAFAQMFTAQVKGQVEIVDGKVMGKNEDGTGKDLATLVAEARKGPMGILFESSNNSSGSGTKPSNIVNMGKGRYTTDQIMQMSPIDRIRLAREQNIN